MPTILHLLLHCRLTGLITVCDAWKAVNWTASLAYYTASRRSYQTSFQHQLAAIKFSWGVQIYIISASGVIIQPYAAYLLWKFVWKHGVGASALRSISPCCSEKVWLPYVTRGGKRLLPTNVGLYAQLRSDLKINKINSGLADRCTDSRGRFSCDNR